MPSFPTILSQKPALIPRAGIKFASIRRSLDGGYSLRHVPTISTKSEILRLTGNYRCEVTIILESRPGSPERIMSLFILRVMLTVLICDSCVSLPLTDSIT